MHGFAGTLCVALVLLQVPCPEHTVSFIIVLAACETAARPPVIHQPLTPNKRCS